MPLSNWIFYTNNLYVEHSSFHKIWLLEDWMNTKCATMNTNCLQNRFFWTSHGTNTIVMPRHISIGRYFLILLFVMFLIITLAATMETQYPAVRPEILHREFIFWILELLEHLFAWWLNGIKVCKHVQHILNFMCFAHVYRPWSLLIIKQTNCLEALAEFPM